MHGKTQKPWLLFALLFCCCVGCGGSGVERTAISGKVTFKGQPVPSGLIYFTPDTSRGNSGPQGFAEITDGKYSTDNLGLGAVTGPMVVQITGYAEAKNNSEAPQTLLFPTYQTTVEVDQNTKTLDFEIQ